MITTQYLGSLLAPNFMVSRLWYFQLYVEVMLSEPWNLVFVDINFYNLNYTYINLALYTILIGHRDIDDAIIIIQVLPEKIKSFLVRFKKNSNHDMFAYFLRRATKKREGFWIV